MSHYDRQDTMPQATDPCLGTGWLTDSGFPGCFKFTLGAKPCESPRGK
jgi:hypothetical protein